MSVAGSLVYLYAKRTKIKIKIWYHKFDDDLKGLWIIHLACSGCISFMFYINVIAGFLSMMLLFALSCFLSYVME